MTRRRPSLGCWLLLLGLAGIPALPVAGQGISFVTRRTPTVQKQVPARQFFDAAGISVAGSATNGTGTAGLPAAGVSLGANGKTTISPAPASPTVAARPASGVRLPPPGPARGYLVSQPLPARAAVPTHSTASRPANDRRHANP